ncbi:enoyl-CoA hydratase/isomerase family protein [Neobacillus sp. NPDC097160]|uniref:enoyl-CoA hydratase/isomerase family protein n=1 Tax=Neobacillus sp. NPDC097160 TaxID=3364298 RepID=UPI0038225577
MKDYKYLILAEPETGILEVTLSRPKQLNALSMNMVDELFHLTSELRGALANKYKVVIIRGDGRAFCSGGDIKEFLNIYEQDNSTIENYISKILRFAKVWYELPIPTIASLHGAVAGGGASLALACDIRIAAENTKIYFNFSRIGLIPDMGAHYLLPKLIGEARSLEIFYTGRPILPSEAIQIGLVNQVVGNEELQQQSVEYARQFTAGNVYKHIKQLVKASNDSLDLTLHQEAILQTERFKSKEFKEYMDVFFNK